MSFTPLALRQLNMLFVTDQIKIAHFLEITNTSKDLHFGI